MSDEDLTIMLPTPNARGEKSSATASLPQPRLGSSSAGETYHGETRFDLSPATARASLDEQGARAAADGPASAPRRESAAPKPRRRTTTGGPNLSELVQGTLRRFLSGDARALVFLGVGASMGIIGSWSVLRGHEHAATKAVQPPATGVMTVEQAAPEQRLPGPERVAEPEPIAPVQHAEQQDEPPNGKEVSSPDGTGAARVVRYRLSAEQQTEATQAFFAALNMECQPALDGYRRLVALERRDEGHRWEPFVRQIDEYCPELSNAEEGSP